MFLQRFFICVCAQDYFDTVFCLWEGLAVTHFRCYVLGGFGNLITFKGRESGIIPYLLTPNWVNISDKFRQFVASLG